MTQEDKIREFWQFAISAAWDQHRRHPELSRGECLRERSYLYSLLGGESDGLLDAACRIADESDDPAAMQPLFPQILDAAVRSEAEKISRLRREFEPDSPFRYTLLENRWCYIHIHNHKQPESFLDFPEETASHLRHLMDKAEKENGCTVLYTASWLNSLPAFLRFFPEEWQQNITASADGQFGRTLGWQGQFINRAGTLNKKSAGYFLENGIYPYDRASSHCSFASLRKHLENF